MEAEAIPVHYTRVPLGEDAAPSERGFERLLEACLRFDVTAALIFACRDGVTRTSTGMVIGKARYHHSFAHSVPVNPHPLTTAAFLGPVSSTSIWPLLL